MNNYRLHIEAMGKIVSNFPQAFAFNDDQLKEAMVKLGAKTKDELIGTSIGGIILKKDKQKYLDMLSEVETLEKEFLKDEKNLYEAFFYELANHEFCVTYIYDDTLNALGLSYETLTDKQKEILEKAKKEYLEKYEW